MLHLTEQGPFLQLNRMPVKATSKINLICIEKNTTSLIFVNEGQSLITRPLCGTQALNKPRSSLLVFGAKNGQKTNRMCMDLISRFVVRAQKLIFSCRPSGLGEADQVMPNMAPMYVGHRPPLLCQRWSLWMAHLSMCCIEMFPHYCTCQCSASGWPISVLAQTQHAQESILHLNER